MVTHGKTTVGHNAQVAVDAKHKLIVKQHITNAGNDLGLLAQTAGAGEGLAGDDVYRCPGGQRLDTRCHSVVRGQVTVQYSKPNACAACAIKARCTSGRYRRVNRWENEAMLDRMAERLAARPDLLPVRRETLEHPFGSIKRLVT